jgi:hypothetical protein
MATTSFSAISIESLGAGHGASWISLAAAVGWAGRDGEPNAGATGEGDVDRIVRELAGWDCQIPGPVGHRSHRP